MGRNKSAPAVGWCWLLAGALVGCHANPPEHGSAESAAENKPAPGTAALSPVAPAPPVAARGAAFAGYRRYRGTVGGQPVTLELTVGPGENASDSVVCEGRYRYERHPAGALRLRAPRPFDPRQPGKRPRPAPRRRHGPLAGRAARGPRAHGHVAQPYRRGKGIAL